MDDWQDRAACKGMDPDLFHPFNPWRDWRQVREAKQVCASCPVTAECLEMVMDAESETWGGRSIRVGIYAGLTPSERAKLLRESRRASNVSPSSNRGG